MTQRYEFWRLINELLESRTVYDTIHILELKGASEEEIREELRRRHGLTPHQVSQALREYRKIQRRRSP